VAVGYRLTRLPIRYLPLDVIKPMGQLCGNVLLADRYHALMEGVRGLLGSSSGRVFMVADEASLLQGAERLAPTLVVVDLSLGSSDFLRLLAELRARVPSGKLLVLSVHDEPAVARSVLEAGADGVVLKRAIATDLMAAVDAVLDGGTYVSPLMGRGNGKSLQGEGGKNAGCLG
jgi:DNA-binding NarL/FixJ family response regulator